MNTPGMNTPVYRPARVADIAAMSRIRLAVTENALRDPSRVTYAMYVDHIEGRGRSWIAEVDGLIAGFASADGEAASVWALFIDPAYEGRGIGKCLLALLVEHMAALGKSEIHLSTTAGTRADAFYAAQGWQRGDMNDAVEVHYALPLPPAKA